jgi:CBS domain containing-hemolysin-like protein
VEFLILTVLITMTISFLCSLLEACLMSLSVVDIAKISEKNKFVGSIWKNFRDNIQKPIAVILIINTFANSAGAAIAGSQFIMIFEPKWIWLFSIIFSLLIIQWSEILPKTLGYRNNKTVAKIFGLPLRALVYIFSPLVWITQFLNKPFVSKQKKSETETLGNIDVLTRFAALNNLITKEQAKLIMRSIGLSQAKILDIMLPRDKIKFLSSNMSLQDALLAAHLHYHTRYPIVENGDLDKIIGYVNFKDIVMALHINPQNPTLYGITRPIMVVMENEKVTNALNKFFAGHHHIAIVRNEKGSVTGLVTLEDVIEEVFGEIQDEFDILPCFIRAMPEKRFLVGGATQMSDLKRKICEDFPDTNQTIDEWIRSHFKKSLTRNTQISIGQYNFIVTKIRRSHIHEVIIECKKSNI